MYGKWLFVAAFLFILPLNYAIQISEIMYNPSGSDTGREWIEIYNNDNEVNLSDWKLVTDGNHVLNVPPKNGGVGSLLIGTGKYAVIAQDASAFLKDYPTYSGILIDSSWTALTNSEPKQAAIKNGNITVASATYSIVNEGSSWCPTGECTPSPGMPNGAEQQPNQDVNSDVPPEQIDVPSTPELFYPKEVYVGDVFEINLSVNSSNHELYSYVYRNRTPVSLGFNGEKWLGSWDANKIEVSGLSHIALKNIIENGTKPGNYTLRVRLDGNDISGSVEVFEKPFLKINKTKTGALVYTNCDSCRILVVGPVAKSAVKNYTINESGNYNVVLMKGQSVISTGNITIAKPIQKKSLSPNLSIFVIVMSKLRLF